MGALSFSVGHGANILKKVASVRMFHQPYDNQSIRSYPLSRMVSYYILRHFRRIYLLDKLFKFLDYFSYCCIFLINFCRLNKAMLKPCMMDASLFQLLILKETQLLTFKKIWKVIMLVIET